MKPKIDLNKFVCSLMKRYYEKIRIDPTTTKCWLDSVLEDQGLEYKDGEIVEIEQESEDEKVRNQIINFIKEYGNPAHCEWQKEWITWLEKQGNPADKIEPKFKNGQWIIFNGWILHIDEVVNGYYRTTSIGGIRNSYDWDIDNVARSWTIQDAKDGDVLASAGCIFIFKKINDGWIYCYCLHHPDGSFIPETYNLMTIKYSNEVYPATLEECEKLEKATKEAGYEWNTEKKELKKIEKQSNSLPIWKYKKDNKPLLHDSLILNKYGRVAKSPSGAIVSDVWVIDYDELAKLPKEELEKQGDNPYID